MSAKKLKINANDRTNLTNGELVVFPVNRIQLGHVLHQVIEILIVGFLDIAKSR